jgi:cytochrome c peroxidase
MYRPKMKPKILFPLLILIWFGIISFSRISIFNQPKHFPKAVYNFNNNALNHKKIMLGRMLFYDPILSIDSTVSCASCHLSYTAFAHTDHNLSHGVGDSIGTRNAPSLMNLAWQKKFMWDGAISNLDVQSLAPISHPREMGESISHVLYKLNNNPLYQNLFQKAYRKKEIESYELLTSLSQFMLTFISANSKYDSVMFHSATFSVQEQNGYLLFKKNCSSCHKEPLFSSFEFKNNGLPIDTILNDVGRYAITLNPADSFCFKIPSLRNIEFSYPYMHDGRFKKLIEVLNHYTNGISQKNTLAHELKIPIVLTKNEKIDIIAFLLTLSDRDFVLSKDFTYPKKSFSKAKE